MNFERITNFKKEVRVIGDTYYPTDKTKEMIGKEFRVAGEDYNNEIITIQNKTDNLDFFRSDVQFLTPLSFKERRIAIGDEIKSRGKWGKVYDFSWLDGEWRLLIVRNNDLKEGCYISSIIHIRDHRILDKIETIKIGKKEYNKKEIEEALKNIKSLN